MIRVIFKRIEKSEFAKDLVIERIETVRKRFPDLYKHRITITLSMENSASQSGANTFSVKVFIQGNRYQSMTIEKSATNLFIALADVIEHALERLNRYGDKQRVRRIKQERELNSLILNTKEYENATKSA